MRTITQRLPWHATVEEGLALTRTNPAWQGSHRRGHYKSEKEDETSVLFVGVFYVYRLR
jgi:hypothetical protein